MARDGAKLHAMLKFVQMLILRNQRDPLIRPPQALMRMVLGAAAFATIILGGTSFLSEYRLAFFLNGTANQQIEALSHPSERLDIPQSPRSMRDATASCGRLLRFAPRLKAEPELRPAVAEACGTLARTILARAPTHARAQALALLAAPTRSAGELRIAQATAAFEPWPLSLRLAAIGEVAPNDPEWAAAAMLDIGRALESRWGRDTVAALYLETPILRPTIVLAAEGLAGPHQAEFLRRVRQITRAAP